MEPDDKDYEEAEDAFRDAAQDPENVDEEQQMITILYDSDMKPESRSKPPATLTTQDFWILGMRIEVFFKSNMIAYIYDDDGYDGFVLLMKNRWGRNGAIITLREFLDNIGFNENWRAYE